MTDDQFINITVKNDLSDLDKRTANWRKILLDAQRKSQVRQ